MGHGPYPSAVYRLQGDRFQRVDMGTGTVRLSSNPEVLEAVGIRNHQMQVTDWVPLVEIEGG